jgi:DNA polymerase-3 subunit chi
MTKVDFYLLAGAGQDAREIMACKLIDKIYQLNHKVYVHTDSPEDANRIDELLWTLKPGSFIPHNIVSDKDSTEKSAEKSAEKKTEAPVVIGHEKNAPQIDDVLINLTHEVPLFFSQFKRVAEFVDAEDSHRSLGRTRFKFYKDRGYELDTHEITK